MPRPRRPEELKKQDGTFQPCRSTSPDVSAAIITNPADCPPPELLDEAELAVWDEVVPRIIALGVIAPSDIDSLVSYVQVLSESRELAKMRKRLPIMDADGGKDRSSVFRQWKSCQDLLRSMRKDFGMTPADRAGAPKTDIVDSDDPLSSLITAGK